VPIDSKDPGKTIKEDFVSIIYSKKNDSPKYFEIKKSTLFYFFVGLPSITLIALFLGAIGLVHTSPFHLIDNYRKNSLARHAISDSLALKEKINLAEKEKMILSKQVGDLQEKLKSASSTSVSTPTSSSGPTHLPEKSCPAAPAAPTNTTGLSSLALFRPIQGQKDKTRPPTLTLTDFKIVSNRDTVNFQFNIIPALAGESKLAGHIIVMMKNEMAIQFYPTQTLYGPGTQLNFTSGEPFATQRFRPVDAAFSKPKKSGNGIFIVYIFAKNGDLIHNQSIMMPVKI
jgi:hypothetical protein